MCAAALTGRASWIVQRVHESLTLASVLRALSGIPRTLISDE
jgi:hypothetical protein